MAIELRKTGYCKDCPHFEPETFSAEITSNDNGYSVIQTDIKCEHEDACERMEKKILNIEAELLKHVYCTYTLDDPDRRSNERVIKELFSTEIDCI